MADKPIVTKMKLPKSVRADLLNAEGRIKQVEGAVEALKKIGMDTQEIEDQLAWAMKARNILLEDFD